MSDTTIYDPDNIFAKILSGAMPSQKVYEDDTVLAFLDVMPQSAGHTLVIPKSASRNLLDADPEVLQDLVIKTQKIARAVKLAMQADGIRLAQFNEHAAGQTVFHLHVHVIPMYAGKILQPHTGAMADSAELDRHAQAIRAALA